MPTIARVVGLRWTERVACTAEEQGTLACGSQALAVVLHVTWAQAGMPVLLKN
jgi:hypothetical protein